MNYKTLFYITLAVLVWYYWRNRKAASSNTTTNTNKGKPIIIGFGVDGNTNTTNSYGNTTPKPDPVEPPVEPPASTPTGAERAPFRRPGTYDWKRRVWN